MRQVIARCWLWALLLLGTSHCSPHVVAPLPASFARGAGPVRVHADSLRATVEALANAWSNLGRFAAVRRRAVALGLSPSMRSEWIDWFTLQRNLLIEISGHSEEIVYVVAHYDKTDINPFKLVSVLVNGAVDELAGVTYLSQGATDNATGVAVALELAAALKNTSLQRTYRILLTGAEESGLRGARAHVARLSAQEKNRIAFVVNLDTVGLDDRPNCVTGDVSDPKLVSAALDTAHQLGVRLGVDVTPLGAQSDYLPFAVNSFWRDFGRGLEFNLVGGLLPQRSWFTGAHTAPAINFSACDVVGAWDYVGSALLLPIGRLHGVRDRTGRVSPSRLYEQFTVLRKLLQRLDAGAGTHLKPRTPQRN